MWLLCEPPLLPLIQNSPLSKLVAPKASLAFVLSILRELSFTWHCDCVPTGSVTIEKTENGPCRNADVGILTAAIEGG